jgi:hypothetical protein
MFCDQDSADGLLLTTRLARVDVCLEGKQPHPNMLSRRQAAWGAITRRHLIVWCRTQFHAGKLRGEGQQIAL